MSSNPYKITSNDNDDNNSSSPYAGRTTSSPRSTRPNEDGYDGNFPNHDYNQDTFLSRIFGLNSIYNQLQDNYQYYDPEYDSAYHQNLLRSSLKDAEDEETFGVPVGDHANLAAEDGLEDDGKLMPGDGIQLKPVANASQSRKSKMDVNSNSLLDSESDSDLSSSSDSYIKPARPRPKGEAPIVEQAQSEQPRLVQAKQELASNDAKSRPSIKFQIPQRAKSIVGKFKEPTLPLYSQPPQSQSQPQPQPHRKPQQKPYANTNYKPSARPRSARLVIPPRERALYLWANITNMDEFLGDVYYYYRERGLVNIVLTRIVDLLILVFIINFTIFLRWGIDYSKFLENYHEEQHLVLSDLVVANYFSQVPFFINFLFFGFSVYVILRSIQLYFDYNYKLKEIKNFYRYLLDVGDTELMTISWKTIVEKLMLLKDYNSLTSTQPIENHYINDLSSKIRLNAHDIANRIMRRENYMIALINKDILDLSVLFMNEKSVLTKTLEWNLKLCIDNFVFNKQGQINGSILKEYNRNQLARELKSRFKLAAMINVVLCPFIVIYFVLRSFFKYFNEYKSNPSSIVGLRQYTPFAHWKLREFNELPHFFSKRLQLSQGPANTYIDQFPKGFFVLNGMKLVNFISGSILAILVIFGIFLENESHSFWSFEITEGRSTLFYISIFGTLWAVTSSSGTPDTQQQSQSNYNHNTFAYDPEANIKFVSQFTHYLPSSWNKKLHTIQVKNEFCELYSLKIIIILNEIMSLILTPFILWFKVSRNSGAIVDFFREYSIHVDGLGYVCYFAMFNFEEKDKNMMHGGSSKRKNKKLSRSNKLQAKSQSNSKTNANAKAKAKISKSDSEHSGDEAANVVPPTTSVKANNGRVNAIDLISDDDDDDDDDDGYDSDHYDALEYFQNDDKMMKSYMYFLKSYGGKGNAASGTGAAAPGSSSSARRPINQAPPGSHSLSQHQQLSKVNRKMDPFANHDGANDAINFDDSSLMFPDIDDNLGDDSGVGDRSKRKGGVLGMLNQFYKQEVGQNARV
ncbi:uncharacterized protein LODBEIA_P33290 [Lodderomyces beijingensis]|uniref:Autophagy-related protein 9 n=1 Tax=Lodderomyces beijingensis TaxID=1775926 RepID=A0ABP0ZSB6_9ASCO